MRSFVSVEEIAELVAEVLGLPLEAVGPDTGLTLLGLESFTAVRLRRRLGDLGLDLPMTAFLGDATARTIADGITDPGMSADTRTSAEGITEPGVNDDARGLAGSGGGGGFPLTPLQTAYWIGREPSFPLGGVATFYYREYDRVPGAEGPEADLTRLTAAWNRLVEHHPMLRMIVDAQGRQRILPATEPYEIAVDDLRDAGAEGARERLERLRYERSHQVRPADRWPLFDLRAAFLPDGRTRLFLGIDVLALDLAGWMQILAEWGRLVADPSTELPASAVSFDELVRRRHADPDEARNRERDMEYWRGRALPSGPRLPWAEDLAEVRSHRFARSAAELDVAEWRALRDRAAERGLSPTGVLLAAFGLVLARWGADEAFCLNTTLFDRPDDPELAHLVGDFTSTVLVEFPRVDLREWNGFERFAASINRRFWTDMEHRTVSGVEVLRETGGADLTPTHPVVFTSGLGLADPDTAPAGWLGEEVFGISQTPQVALDHIVHDEGGRLRIAWDAVEGVFPDGFVDGMRDAHLTLLRGLATEAGAWNDPALGWDPTFLPGSPLDVRPFPAAGPLLDDPLRAAARALPKNPALLDTSRSLTHGELAERRGRVGSALTELGVGPGDLVAVAFPKGIEQVTALLGVCAGGAGYVPVEPTWPESRVASVCEQAGVRHAVVPDDLALRWPSDVTVHRLSVLEKGGAQPTRTPRPDDLAYVIFTSGSTGRPKGVAIEHRAARTTIDDLIDRFPVGPDDRVLGLSAFSFDLSVHDIFGVAGTGAALVLPDADRQRDPGHWLDLMEKHRVTVWNTAPALMEMLVEYAEIEPERARAALEPLRLVFLSADWIPVTLPDKVRALAPNARLVGLGGATEASIWSICFPIGEVPPSWPSIPYGRPLRGQSFHILDAEGRPCPVGRPGELHIGGDGLARCYIGDDRQTRERFIAHPVLGRLYRTGDLGRWRPDGNIEFMGRLDRQVKIRGHRIELGEVESVLDRVPGVRHSVALSVRGPDDRPRLVGYLVAADAANPPDDERLIAHLRERVPDYMVPSRFVRLDAFPVTENGKIDYKALPNPYGRTPEPPRPHPRSRPRPQPSDDLAALFRQASEQGLGLSLRVTGGGLTPSRALSTAGTWAERLRATAAAHGLTLSEHLTPGALIELTTSPAPPAGPVAADVPAAPEVPASAAPKAAASGEQVDAEVERVVSEVLSGLLGGAEIDPTTPFFRLGATSLTLVRAHGKLTEALDPGLAVVDMFSRPTVRRLAAHISGRRDGRAAPEQPADAPPVPIRRAQARRMARRRAEEVAQ
ncbi:non-ribosomal peptide synthetase [Thermomonospora umbrina]|uniref:Phenyloxazoline synthase MbtB n=1 Tax=Thermomonospora umbrina TaxID=111806 RepID=A0A3D9SMB6_9ACTN|nr:non-ribosomal peptide synthetase [Thermomonospora umbrina]REE95073.1 amino acid adenylation domain-containing protein [Thermomonospora umbrina]